MASTGSAVSQGILTLPWPSQPLNTAAVKGFIIAAGGREGVRAWDVRRAASSSSISAGGSGGSKRLLLSGCLPNKAHVSHLHLDSLKLVAASSQTKLHSAAGIAVWSLPDGNRLELPSSWWVQVPYAAMARGVIPARQQASTYTLGYVVAIELVWQNTRANCC